MCSKCAVCSVQSSICGHLDIAPRPVKTPDDDRCWTTGQPINSPIEGQDLRFVN